MIPCSTANETRRDDPLEHRLTVDAERFELQVRDRRLDHARADLELDERFHVGLDRAGEAPDLGVQTGVADQLYSTPVILRDARKAGFDPLDPQLVEPACELELVFGIEHDPHGLLAVAKRRVVEPDVAP